MNEQGTLGQTQIQKGGLQRMKATSGNWEEYGEQLGIKLG